MKFRSMFDGLQAEESLKDSIYTDPETAQFAQQSDKDSCDINQIMERYIRTGIFPDFEAREAFYADITKLQSANAYQESLDAVITAQRAFDTLPANIRSSFGNDPKAFVDAIDKKQYTKEMIDAGLIEVIERPTPSDKPDTVADQLVQKT